MSEVHNKETHTEGMAPEWYISNLNFDYPEVMNEGKIPPFHMTENLREKLHTKLKDYLPQPPASFHMYQKLNDPNTSPSQFAAIASQDPFFVARILKCVNSAIFGLRNQITEVGRAVVFLGYNNIRSLALAHCLQSKEIMKNLDMDLLQTIWKHSGVVGALCSSFGKHHAGINSLEMNTLGLLHDMGRILVETTPMKKNLSRLPDQLPLPVIEALCGSIFAQAWGLPDSVVRAIEFAPYPGYYAVEYIPEDIRKESCLLYLSNLLANLYGFSDEHEWPAIGVDALSLLHMAHTPEKWITPEITEDVDKALNLFQYR